MATSNPSSTPSSASASHAPAASPMGDPPGSPAGAKGDLAAKQSEEDQLFTHEELNEIDLSGPINPPAKVASGAPEQETGKPAVDKDGDSEMQTEGQPKENEQQQPVLARKANRTIEANELEYALPGLQIQDPPKDLDLDDPSFTEPGAPGPDEKEANDSYREMIDDFETTIHSPTIELVRNAVKKVANENKLVTDMVINQFRRSDKPRTFKRKIKSQDDKKGKGKGKEQEKGNQPIVASVFDPTKFAHCVAVAPKCQIADGAKAEDFLFGYMKKTDEQQAWLHVKFGIGTQLPHIVLKVDIDQDRHVYIYIFGTHLSRKQKPAFEMLTGMNSKIKSFVREKMGDGKLRPDVHELMKENLLTMVELKTLGGQGDYYDVEDRATGPIIRGDVTSAILDSWAKDAQEGTSKSYAERFVGLIHAGRLRHLKFLVRYASDDNQAEYPDQHNFCEYFAAVMTLTRVLGNLWGFRRQAPEDKWTSSLLPFWKIEPLPWTVTHWDPQEKDSDDWDRMFDEEYKPPVPVPARWGSIDIPAVYPGMEEAQFVTALGVTDERKYQYDYTARLLKSHAGQVDVVLHRNPHNTRYFLADVYTDISANKLRPIAPLPDTGVALKLATGMKLVGRVTVTGRNPGAARAKDPMDETAEPAANPASEPGSAPAGEIDKAPLPKFGQGSGPRLPDFQVSVSAPRGDVLVRKEMKVELSFTDDNTVFKRQMRAAIRAALPQWKSTGAYIPQIVYGAPVPKGFKPNAHREELKKAQKQIYFAELARAGLDESQMAFAKECLMPSNGLAIAQGPPGTGKSGSLHVIIQALAKAGFKVLVTSPTNGGSENLIGNFIKNPDSKAHNGQWCIFNGGYAKSGYRREKEVSLETKSKPKAKAKPKSKSKTKTKPKPAATDATDSSNKEQDADPDSEILPTVEELDGLGAQVEKAQEEAERQAAEKAELEELEDQELMANYWIQQASRTYTTKSMDHFGFDFRRVRLAQVLANRDWAGPLKEYAQNYLEMLPTATSLKGKEKKTFMRYEDSINEYLLKKCMKVVFSTCNMAGHEILESFFEPDIIIVDEAAAGADMEVAIPLTSFRERVKGIIIVGDFHQIPPTFVSAGRNSAAGEMTRTIFERFAREEMAAATRLDTRPMLHFLDTQYRSHPDIMAWAARAIYGGRLKHGPNTSDPNPIRRTLDQYFQRTLEYFKRDEERDDAGNVTRPARARQTYRMGVHVNESPSAGVKGDTSLQNRGEIDFIVSQINSWLDFVPSDPGTQVIQGTDIRVCTGYGAQKKALREALRDKSLTPGCADVEVTTIAGVQGREAPITIFTLVQNNPGNAASVGFIKLPSNLNVSSTRARDFSLTVGNFEHWMQAIANSNKKMMMSTRDKFRDYVMDFHEMNDIIDAYDLVKVRKNHSLVLTRDQGAWPRTFQMSEKAKSHQGVVNEPGAEPTIQTAAPSAKEAGKARAPYGDDDVKFPDVKGPGNVKHSRKPEPMEPPKSKKQRYDI